MRSRSRSAAASARLRSVMSRATFDAPMTWPSLRIGETVSEIGSVVPSFRCLMVS